jgi:hypothetical protein
MQISITALVFCINYFPLTIPLALKSTGIFDNLKTTFR